MSLVGLLKGTGPSGFGYSSTAEQVTEGLSLAGKAFLVTGSTAGLGTETVRVLGLRGARVFAAGRSKEKVVAALGNLPGAFTPVACDLASPHSVRACAAAIKAEGAQLDGIIANAGIMALPELEQAFGIELQFFTNHIGHFLLITSLLDQLAERARVVILSSGAHTAAPKVGVDFQNLSGERGYSAWSAYGQSKLANLLFAKQLAKRLAGTGKIANALHPGVIRTSLQRSMPAVARAAMDVLGPIALKSVPEGAATQCYVAARPELEGVTGEYFADCNRAQPSALARDAQLAERLWEESERIVARLP
jgi:NAD(P)-dependent dehydrogenase (short-subunit alcohol dehydrogenase family)